MRIQSIKDWDINAESYDDFLVSFQDRIIEQAGNNGIEVERKKPSDMLYSVLSMLDKKAVIIADEYDTPILHTYRNTTFAKVMY